MVLVLLASFGCCPEKLVMCQNSELLICNWWRCLTRPRLSFKHFSSFQMTLLRHSLTVCDYEESSLTGLRWRCWCRWHTPWRREDPSSSGTSSTPQHWAAAAEAPHTRSLHPSSPNHCLVLGTSRKTKPKQFSR